MPSRNLTFANGEYYHLCNRGVEKKQFFSDKKDYIRFLFLLLYNQSPVQISKTGRYVEDYIKHRTFDMSAEKKSDLLEKRFIEVTAFSIMPNHFHILAKEVGENGIVQYMQRIQNAYAKYFNIKYEHTGHVFQGPFRARRIENNTDLLHISAYIHLNSRELSAWNKKELQYPWSSFQDFVLDNRWGALLNTSIISEQFATTSDYKKFIETSTINGEEI